MSISGIEHANMVTELLKAEQVNPGRSQQDVFDDGEFLLMVAGPRMWTIEAWINILRRRTQNEKIDWSQAGGRAVVKFLGSDEDRKKLIQACVETKGAFEKASQLLADLHKKDKQNVAWAYPVQWGEVPWGTEDGDDDV